MGLLFPATVIAIVTTGILTLVSNYQVVQAFAQFNAVLGG